MSLTVGNMVSSSPNFQTIYSGLIQQEMTMLQSSSSNSVGLGAFAAMIGTNANLFDQLDSAFTKNQALAISEMNTDAQNLSQSITSVYSALDPNMGTVTSASVGAAMQQFVTNYNTFQSDLTNGSDYIDPSFLSNLNAMWNSNIADGSGFGLTQNSDGTLQFNQSSLDSVMANGVDPNTNSSLGSATTFLSGVSAALDAFRTVPMSKVMSQNPYDGSADQLRQYGQTYDQTAQTVMLGQEMSVLFNALG